MVEADTETGIKHSKVCLQTSPRRFGTKFKKNLSCVKSYIDITNLLFNSDAPLFMNDIM